MNKKFSTLVAVLLAAGAWTTLEAKVVEVAAPQIGNAYVIGTSVDEVSDEITSLLNADGTITAEATEVTATTTKWTLEGIPETDFFYLKNSEEKYLSIASEAGENDWVEYAETTEHAVKFKFDADGKTLRVAETISNTGTFQAECPLVIQNNKIRVAYGQTGAEGTPFAFALYTSEEVPAGMPGLEDVITVNGEVNKETLTGDITVKAPLNIKLQNGNYLVVKTNDAGEYVLEATEGDKAIDALTASNSLAASWEWQAGKLVSTASLRCGDNNKIVALTYTDGKYDVASVYAATNFAVDKAGIEDATISVSATSFEGEEYASIPTSGIIAANPISGNALEKLSSVPSDYVVVMVGDYYLQDAGTTSAADVQLANSISADDYKQFLWSVSRSQSGNVFNYTFTNLATGKTWTENGYSTFVGAGDVSGLTLTLNSQNIGISGTDVEVGAATKAIVSFYEAPMAAKKLSELNAIYNPGFAMTIKISKDGKETIEDVDKFNGTLYPTASSADATTVRIWDNDEYAAGHNAKMLVLDKTTKVGSDDNSNVEGSFKWISEKEYNKNTKNYEANFQFLYSLSSGKNDGADIEWVKVGNSYLYILSTGNNRYQLTTINGITEDTAQPYIVLQSNNVVNVTTLLGKYLTFSFVNNQDLAQDGSEEYKLNGILSVANRDNRGDEADYVKASSVLANAPETQWVITDANKSANTFTITNREADVKITGVTLRNNNDGTYTLYSTESGSNISADVVKMTATTIVGTRHMDGFMDAKPGELRNQVFHIGQYHYETGNSTAFWTENHQSNRSHQLGVTTSEENAVNWKLAIQMQRDEDDLVTADADTIYITRNLASLNSAGNIVTNEVADTLAILQYTFQNQGNLEYVIYNEGNNLNYYQCQEDYSWDGENVWTGDDDNVTYPAVRFALKMKPDSTYNIIPIDKSYNEEAEAVIATLTDKKVYVANSEQWGSVKHMDLYAADNNSLMQVLPVDRPEYRQIEMVWGDTIKLWRNENESQVVYEKRDDKSIVNDETLSFLNIDNDNQFDMNPAIFADTAYINRWDADGVKNTCYQYLLAVDVENVSEYFCPLTPEHNTDAWREANGGPCPDAKKSAYVEGRFLVNLIDTANVYGLTHLHNNPYINRTEEGNDCAKLSFVEGVHAGDTLYLFRGNGDTIKLALDTPDFNVAKFAFKYEDVEEGSFKIQTQWKKYLAPENEYTEAKDFAEAYEDAAAERNESMISNEGYLRFVNGCLVVDKNYQKGDIFNMTERYTAQAPTANEEISAENAAVSVVATEGAVIIKGAEGKNVVIATILGKVVANETVNSDNETIAVPAGIAVVSVDGESFKVVVK